MKLWRVETLYDSGTGIFDDYMVLADSFDEAIEKTKVYLKRTGDSKENIRGCELESRVDIE